MDQNSIKSANKIYKDLIAQKKVSLYVHELPDLDALSSAFALQEFLIKNKVDCRIVGLESIPNKKILDKFYENIDNKIADEAFVKQSVAVILDTANVERVHANNFKNAKKSYRIDHHPQIQTFADFEWINPKMSSTSEMVGWLIFLNNKSAFNQRIANFLYSGILADTGKFMYDLTKASTFDLVSHFYKYNFDKNKIQDAIFLHKWKDFQSDLRLYKKVKVVNTNIAYLLITKKTIRRYKLSDNPIKIYMLNDFIDFKIWLTISYDLKNNNWRCSIRSREYDVSLIAKKYQGGGHQLASGFKLKNKHELKEFIEELKKIDISKLKIK